MQAPSLDKDLLESGTIDSLSFVELLSCLEQEFSIRISLDDLDLNQFRSIARIGEFIGTRLSTPAETSDSAGLRVAR
jgi:acyl carrier protein